MLKNHYCHNVYTAAHLAIENSTEIPYRLVFRCESYLGIHSAATEVEPQLVYPGKLSSPYPLRMNADICTCATPLPSV